MSVDRTVPGVCRIFNSPKSECTRDNCRELHVCFFFATGRCRSGDKCLRPHLLTTVHNQAVLKANGWHHDNQHPKILKLLEKTLKPTDKPGEDIDGPTRLVNLVTPFSDTPRVCMAYNNGGCQNARCPLLHVCFDYIMRCNRKGKCIKEHNIFQGQQNIEVLRKYDLLNNAKNKNTYAKIRECYEAEATAKALATKSCAILPARLSCAVCFEPFIRATTLGCTHTFCEDCVRQAERRAQPCPLCRAPITTAVRSLVIDDTVSEWFDGQDEETQRCRRQLETERRRAAAVPQPLMAAPAVQPTAKPSPKKNNPEPKKNNPPGGKQHQRSKSKGRGAKTVVTTTVTYH